MSWSAADIPGQRGRTAVVTGANGGLGLETARQLAAKGAHVVMAVRSQEKAAAAVEEIRATAPDAALELVALDLASQASVRAAAGQIMAAHESIDLLINNAGVMGIPEAKTVDGFEMQFGVDHADGALSQLRAATDPAAKGGEFYGPRFVNSGPPVRKPIVRRLGMDKAIAALWEVSERETGIAIDVRAASAA